MSGSRAMLHLVAAPGAELEPALAVLPAEVTVLRRDPACFHGADSPQAAALEVDAGTVEPLIEAARELAMLLDLDRSMAIVGSDRVFLEPPDPPSPVRYQYLMHRREDFSHEAYLHRYETIHSAFGLRTPHLDGYVQLHVDLDASAELRVATGLRAAPCDSMSELHLRSIEHFLEGIIADPDIARVATEDEERFVDRARSFGFAHRVV